MNELNTTEGKVYGYARVSTLQQDLSLQVEALINYGIKPEDIYSDKKTGKNLDRVELKDLLSKVKKGDLIIVKKLDRLGRSVSQVTNLIEELTEKGVYVKSIDDHVDTSNQSPMAKAMMHLLAMFSEMERNFIEERTKPAIANAKAKGVKFGRPEVNKNVYDMAVNEYLEGGITSKQIIEKYGKGSNGKDLISEATFFRRLKKAKEERGLI
ncbi:recombinase family protein [Bacillus cereus]|uniref:recombinase family protein n=1 Tax=Bacillus cereus group TaxID=86661 RepID=UPI0022E6ED25|nr:MULTISPECIES: recombinase family protein [Bacillus cereus group]MDA1509613.1 recombinase family protein [Bacillus cereus group sp. TH36-2LC]MDZ4632270.1 recombinase family protein [Bacillus cereus]